MADAALPRLGATGSLPVDHSNLQLRLHCELRGLAAAEVPVKTAAEAPVKSQPYCARCRKCKPLFCNTILF